MKKLFLLALVVLVTLVMVSCGDDAGGETGLADIDSSTLELESSYKPAVIDNLAVIPLITIVPRGSTISSTGMSMTIYNNSGMYLQIYDLHFWLEYVVDGEWTAVGPIRERYNFRGVSQLLPSKDNILYVVGWNSPNSMWPYYGILPNGDYRIVMVFPLGDEEKAYATAEFSIG